MNEAERAERRTRRLYKAIDPFWRGFWLLQEASNILPDDRRARLKPGLDIVRRELGDLQNYLDYLDSETVKGDE